MARLGFVGLGQMGRAMARNLMTAGHALTVFDISPDAVSDLAEAGAKPAAHAKAAALGAEVVFTMLPVGAIVEEAIFGPDGIVDGMAPGTILVDMSTILPDETRALGARLAERGISMVDAPVGRTSDHAIAGTVTFMVGGALADVDRVSPLLACMGEKITYCGALGAGAVVKLVNNYISAVTNLVTAEGLAYGLAAGASQDTMVEVLAETPAGRGHIGTSWPARALVDDPTPTFTLDLARKDIGLALTAAAASKVPLSTGAVAREVYTMASAQGHGGQDWSTGIYRAVKALGGIKP